MMSTDIDAGHAEPWTTTRHCPRRIAEMAGPRPLIQLAFAGRD